MEPGLKLTRTSRAEQDSREYSKLRFAQRSIDHLFKMLPRYGWPVTVSLRQRSQVCSGMLLNNAGLWGNISYIILSSQIIPVVGIYSPHLRGLQFLFILGWICCLKSLKQDRADILQALDRKTTQLNPKQIGGVAFHLIFRLFHRLTVVYVSFCSFIKGITPNIFRLYLKSHSAS